MLRRSLTLFVALVAACGDDNGNNKLPDAPVVPDSMIDAPVDAPILPPEEVPLAIAASGNGSGRITSVPAGIDCGSTCDANFEEGTMITLTAEPDASSLFMGWGGACSGALPVCEVTVDAATSVTATFTLKTYTVTVTKAGTGTGTVTGNGINCGTGAGCSVVVDHGTMISLSAAPANLNVFVGWGGACTGDGTCDVTVTADTAISAGFALDELSLIVTRGGNGAGTITSDPVGINCPGTCDFVFQANQVVTLTANAAGSSTFTGWGAPCTGTGTCVVTMDAAKAVTGSFTLKSYVLDVQKVGTGTGTVTSNPAGIACGTDCDQTYNHGSVITLTATPSVSSTFTRWIGGGCSGTDPCQVALTAATSVDAEFTIKQFALTTTTTTGGSISSSPAGIGCPGDCNQSYVYDTVVTLTATEDPGYTFMGWSGGSCTGTGTCVVTMNQAHTVSATFMIKSYNLDVMVTGMGTVTHAGNIACPNDCQGTYTHGTNVTLTATQATGWTFMNWGGACSGNGACVVSMTQAQNVTATFTINSYLLSVGIAGTGSGVVSAPNITCPGDCNESFTHGTDVTVTQMPSADSNFANWSGACTGTGPCVVPMTQAQSVTANYTIKNYNLNVTIVGTGTVTHAGQIACPGDCLGVYPHGTDVTLTQTAGNGFRFTGWTGACTGLGPCVIDMTMTQNVTATFTPEFPLHVTIAGSTGTVTSNIAGISCPMDCDETYLNSQTVILTAAPTNGATFGSWSGCSSTSGLTCTVAMSQLRNVTATFTPPSFALNVLHNGNGYGAVTATTIINCSNSTVSPATDCSETLTQNTIVTLTATGWTTTSATETSFFNGWSGAGCSGTGTCTVTMDAAKTVIANWELYPNVMFVSSQAISSNMGTGWSNTAASLCKNAVSNGAANLGGVGPGQNVEWKAWISGVDASGTHHARDALGAASGWVRPRDNRPVFAKVDDIATHRIFYPPRIDENGTDVGIDALVWTGTNSAGMYSGSACNGGSSSWVNNDNAFGTQGLASANSAEFTSLGNFTCLVPRRLYCFGVDRQANLNVTKRPGRLAFTSNATFVPNAGGIDVADQICRTEAGNAGLPNANAFRALLAPQGATAMSRFAVSPTNDPWVRVGDQQPLTRRESDMRNGQLVALDAAPNVLANGTRIGGNMQIWTGAQTLMQDGNASGTCGNWQNPAEPKGGSGFAFDTGILRQWFGANFGNTICDSQGMHLVCMENLQ